MEVNYPWKNLKKGQGFFVPCLDTDVIKTQGLNAALAYRYLDARAYEAVKNGRIGVWFYRIPER